MNTTTDWNAARSHDSTLQMSPLPAARRSRLGSAMWLCSLLLIGFRTTGCVQEESIEALDADASELDDAAERVDTDADVVAETEVDAGTSDGSAEPPGDVIDMDIYDGEPIYEQLSYDDPNLVCCLIRELTSLCGALYPGGRRRCDEPPRSEGGFDDATLDPRGWEDTVIDGCPVWRYTGSRFATCRGSIEGSGGSGE